MVDFDDRSVTEIRLAEGALRVVAARLAASNATKEQLARMQGVLDAGDREYRPPRGARPDGTSLTSADLAGIRGITRQFHAVLNEGCNNPVVLRLLRTVDPLTSRPCYATCRSRSATAAGGRGRSLRRPSSHLRRRPRWRRGRGRRLMTEHTRAHHYALGRRTPRRRRPSPGSMRGNDTWGIELGTCRVPSWWRGRRADGAPGRVGVRRGPATDAVLP